VAFRRSFAARAQELAASYAFNAGTGTSIALASGIGNVGTVSERVSPSMVSSAGVAASRGVVTLSDTQPAGIAHAPVVVV
jgi:hypothetical protein